MKLSRWAKKQGISYRTAWRWFKMGQLPVAKNKAKKALETIQNAN
jgi:predicted site-specific integrase-resolvase